MTKKVEPRTRENRLYREEVTSPSVGDENFRETCPRCGWPCTHVFPVYWDSPWNEHGGMCGQCAQEAVATFEVRGWPPPKSEFAESAAPASRADITPALAEPEEIEDVLGLDPEDPTPGDSDPQPQPEVEGSAEPPPED